MQLIYIFLNKLTQFVSSEKSDYFPTLLIGWHQAVPNVT